MCVLSFHITVSHRESKEQDKMGEEAATLVNFSRQTRKEGCKRKGELENHLW